MQNKVIYGGFWVRFLAALMDSIVISALVSFIMLMFGRRYGIFNLDINSTSPITSNGESIITTIFQWAYNIFMIRYYGATLGKMVMKLKVVGDGKELDLPRIVIRETIGKFISGIILGIGYLMVAWDKRKQGLHDKIAGTLVIHETE